MVLLKIVFASLLLGTLQQNSLGLKQECPPESAMQPCFCVKSRRSPLSVVCISIIDPTGEQIRKPILATSQYQVELLLRDSVLGTVPDDLLQGSNISSVSIENVKFDTLDPFAMVSGAKNTLSTLWIKSVFANNWQFSTRANDFREFNSLYFIYDKKNAASPILPEDFLTFLPETMVFIYFENLEIGRVVEPGFSRFPHIANIDLSGNALHAISRKVFPKPALQLRSLDLSDNSLSTLPEDIFEGMPTLQILDLEYNQFTHFDQNTFAPIWDQLINVILLDNPLHCGCDAAWLIQKKGNRTTLLPTCSSPPQFKGRALESLSVSDLCPSTST